MHETNPRTSFSNRWSRSVSDTCHVVDRHASPSHSYTSYLMMPNKSGTTHDIGMALTMINLVGWVGGKFKGQAVLSRAPHPPMILLSDLCNEQIRSLRKALLRSLLLKYCTQLQHPFV